MARDYARIMTSIWRNKEFRALSEQQQRAYLFLVTQPDISAAGVLPLRLRRWADASSTSTADGLAQLFKELESGRFIVVDWDAEELLIRSFIRWDGGFNNPKRRPVIVRDAADVESDVIARHLAMEFKRCGIDAPPDGPSGGGKPVPDSAPDSLSPSAQHAPSKIEKVDPGPDPFPQVNSLSGSESTNRGVVVTLVGRNTTTHNPQPVPPPAGAAAPGAQLAVIGDELPALPEVTAHDVMAVWAEAFTASGRKPTKDQRGKASKDAKQLLDAGNDPALVIALAKAAGAKCRATIANETDLRSSTTTHGCPSTTDSRVAAGIALAEKYARQEVAG